MDNDQLIPHLFRTEYRKIVSVLCRYFGFAQMETAEDLTSDTFLTAAQTWGIKGIPQNPVAWLYNVAKNKARNLVQRDALFDKKIAPDLKSGEEAFPEQDIDLSPQNINDSQLQMMFAICHPVIPLESQIGLSLRILCGFGIEEIADAFLTNKETINKRLFRAREKLREANIPIELPEAAAIDTRLTTVLKTIYLLFNEGYYSLGPNNTLRKELCFEAMRLCTMLVEHAPTNRPAVNALLSLMCFHASRFDARINAAGELILYDEQDTNLWNTVLISKGGYFLHCAASGPTLTQYHLEAGIAYWNTRKEDSQEKWESILQLYNQLLQIAYSPIAALNRTYALSRANGKAVAIIEAEKLQLTNHHFYYLLLGELYTSVDQAKALQYFQQSLLLARTEAERLAIQKKINRM